MLTTDGHKASRGLSATAELLVFIMIHDKLYVIKWTLNKLFFIPQITDKGSDLSGVIWNATRVRFFEAQCLNFKYCTSPSIQQGTSRQLECNMSAPLMVNSKKVPVLNILITHKEV